MRASFPSVLAISILSYGLLAYAQATPFTQMLSVGSTGPQVMLLQQILNRDPDTRVAATGFGSPGNETASFGSRTKAAVIRFQEKYASEVLAPAGLSVGNGRLGAYTRNKLNALSVQNTQATSTKPAHAVVATTMRTTALKPEDFIVKDNEKVDIYGGDRMIAMVQQKYLSAINTAISSGSITLPNVATTDLPSVTLQSVSPQAGLPGARVSLIGNGILANSVIYFGTGHIVHTITKDLFGNYSFIIPPIAAMRYDIVVSTSGAVSNTVPFVVVDPRNPPVHIESVTPAAVSFNSILTITGSGFTPTNNTVITTYQKFTNIPSADGKTMVIQLAPERLQQAAAIGTGTRKVTMSLSVVNDFGFSDSEKLFTMAL